MPEPKRQHYIPQFYLKNFVDPDKPGVLWIRSSTDQSDKWRERGPRAVAFAENYNTINLPDGEVNNDMERMYSTTESVYAPIVEKIIAGHKISADEELMFAAFVGEMFTRVPLTRSVTKQRLDHLVQGQFESVRQDFLNNPEKLTAYINERKAEGKDISAEKLMDYLNPVKYTIGVQDQIATLSAALLNPLYANTLLEMGWIFLHSDATSAPNYFITSDSPAVSIRPKHTDSPNQGLRMPDLEISMPLSRTTCLLAARWCSGVRHADVDADNILSMNSRTASMASRLLIAPKPVFTDMKTVLECWTGMRPKAVI